MKNLFSILKAIYCMGLNYFSLINATSILVNVQWLQGYCHTIIFHSFLHIINICFGHIWPSSESKFKVKSYFL
jgi:hypothetical protein